MEANGKISMGSRYEPLPSSSPSKWARFRRAAGPLLLLSFATTTSLNYASLVRRRREERRMHILQCRLLGELNAQLASLGPTAQLTLSDQRELAARLRSVQVDPRAIGISRSGRARHRGNGHWADGDEADDEDESELQRVRDQQLSWSQVFFGGQGTFARIKESISSVFESVRQGQGPNASASGGGQLDAGQETEEEQAWIRELEERYGENSTIDRSAEPNRLRPLLQPEPESERQDVPARKSAPERPSMAQQQDPPSTHYMASSKSSLSSNPDKTGPGGQQQRRVYM